MNLNKTALYNGEKKIIIEIYYYNLKEEKELSI